MSAVDSGGSQECILALGRGHLRDGLSTPLQACIPLDWWSFQASSLSGSHGTGLEVVLGLLLSQVWPHRAISGSFLPRVLRRVLVADLLPALACLASN